MMTGFNDDDERVLAIILIATIYCSVEKTQLTSHICFIYIIITITNYN